MSSFAHADQPVFNNVGKWLEENEKFFAPPVCNKMMHNTQLKMFYVGGPNQRKDYHLEEGEEFFYMRKGNMCLKIQEEGTFKDVHIKEGEVFLLPGKIPHSPQRDDETIGLVIERERLRDETDGLRYFVDESDEILFEKWFYCDDLGKQLVPIIKAFFDSEQCRTGKAISEELEGNPPWIPDSKRLVEKPFKLEEWIDQNMENIRQKGKVPLFDPSKYQSDIIVYGGENKANLNTSGGELVLWQIRGASTVDIEGSGTFHLNRDENILIPEKRNFAFQGSGDGQCVCLSIGMSPENKLRPLQ